MFVFNYTARAGHSGWNRIGRLGATLLFLSFFACKGDIDGPIEGFTDPVFFVDYQVGNTQDTIHVIAGVEQVYHFSSFRPGDYIVCTGAFAKVDCPEANCPGNLKFEFQNKVAGNTIDKTLFEPGERFYMDVGSVAIQWIDPNEHPWRSDLGAQESSAYFRILRSDAYFPNEKGQATQKMEIAFSCKLFRDGGGAGTLFEGTGTIAVAYP